MGKKKSAQKAKASVNNDNTVQKSAPVQAEMEVAMNNLTIAEESTPQPPKSSLDNISTLLAMDSTSFIELANRAFDNTHYVSRPIQPVGFTNIGSVCYANCVFECFLHLPILAKWLCNLPDAPKALPVTHELQALFNAAASSPATTKAPVLHSMDILSHTIRSFCGPSNAPVVEVPGISLHRPAARHQDIFEFLTFLLDALHSELSTSLTSSLPDVWNEVKSKYKLNIDEKSKSRVFSAVSTSPIGKLFYTVLRSEVTYHSKRVINVSYEFAHCLSLDISRYTSTIDDALQQYFSAEDIDNGTITKQCYIEVAPTILLLHVKRLVFDYTRDQPKKLHTPVAYATTLQLPECILSQDFVGSCYEYALSSLVLHHGKLATSGHYTAICHDFGSNKWFHYDDDAVERVTEAAALGHSAEVYVLVYIRKDVLCSSS